MSSARRPSNGYLYSIAMAAVSIGILGYLFSVRYQGAKLFGIGIAGYFFVAMFAVLFIIRVIFWSRATPAIQNMTRLFVTLVFIATLLTVLVMAGLIVSSADGANRAAQVCFLVAAAVFQVPNVIWLLRYRTE